MAKLAQLTATILPINSDGRFSSRHGPAGVAKVTIDAVVASGSAEERAETAPTQPTNDM